MSAYNEIDTEITDRDCLVEALQELGHVVQVHETPVQLEGYHGDKRQQVADVVIRRKYVGASSNDIGFVKGADGKYKAIVSDYDRHQYGDAWLNKVRQAYAAKKALKLAKHAGMRVVGHKEIPTAQGKRIQYVFQK